MSVFSIFEIPNSQPEFKVAILTNRNTRKFEFLLKSTGSGIVTLYKSWRYAEVTLPHSSSSVLLKD